MTNDIITNGNDCILQLDSVSMSFGEKTLFRDFSYSFNRCGIYAVTGPSGIGKTTLLRIIAGLEKNYTGKVQLKGNVSFAFQEYRLFPTLTAFENISLVSFSESTSDNTETVRKMLSRLNFTEEDMKLYPHELSGGMKQRISLCRAVLYKSDILILDEPTKELDFELCNTVYDIISEEADKRLVILVTHNVSDIERLKANLIEI